MSLRPSRCHPDLAASGLTLGHVLRVRFIITSTPYPFREAAGLVMEPVSGLLGVRSGAGEWNPTTVVGSDR